MPEKLTYCAELVRGHDRPRFWLALFAAAPAREGLYALYALNTELSHLRHMVSEEMIGHIRYAWWREALEALFEGRIPNGHPVLEALLPLAKSGQITAPHTADLLESYATPYPAPPEGEEAALNALTQYYISKTAPESFTGWQQAQSIIARHRSGRLLLLIKLLFAGIRPR